MSILLKDITHCDVWFAIKIVANRRSFKKKKKKICYIRCLFSKSFLYVCKSKFLGDLRLPLAQFVSEVQSDAWHPLVARAEVPDKPGQVGELILSVWWFYFTSTHKNHQGDLRLVVQYVPDEDAGATRSDSAGSTTTAAATTSTSTTADEHTDEPSETSSVTRKKHHHKAPETVPQIDGMFVCLFSQSIFIVYL